MQMPCICICICICQRFCTCICFASIYIQKDLFWFSNISIYVYNSLKFFAHTYIFKYIYIYSFYLPTSIGSFFQHDSRLLRTAEDSRIQSLDGSRVDGLSVYEDPWMTGAASCGATGVCERNWGPQIAWDSWENKVLSRGISSAGLSGYFRHWC